MGEAMAMTRRDTLIVKLEAIRYNLEGLVKYRVVTGHNALRLSKMRRDIEKMLKPYEGVSVYDESNNVGC
jgi:hypothetical protein